MVELELIHVSKSGTWLYDKDDHLEFEESWVSTSHWKYAMQLFV